MSKQKMGFHANSQKWDIEVKPEDATTGLCYAFSYNPEEQPDLLKCDGLSKFISRQHRIFNSCGNCQLELFPEISRMGRWHFHGTVRFTDIMGFYCFDIPKLTASSAGKIAYIEDMSVWVEYCTKQRRFMEKFIERHGTHGQYHFVSGE